MTSQAPLQIRETVGRNIALARASRKMTQRELAQKLGVDSQAISRWERGQVLPGPERLVRLAEALSCEVAWLFTDHGLEAVA